MREFTVTTDHIKLLEHVSLDDWNDCEFGAPSMDPKRPFGDSDVEGDVEEILGRPVTAKEVKALLWELAAIYDYAVKFLLLQGVSPVGLTLKTGWRDR